MSDAPKPVSKKNDQGKARWSLLPWEAAREIVNVLTWAVRPKSEGGNDYPDHGWRNVPNGEERYVDALHRHMSARALGETYDGDSGYLHTAHAGCCIVFLIVFDLAKHLARDPAKTPTPTAQCDAEREGIRCSNPPHADGDHWHAIPGGTRAWSQTPTSNGQ